jgi:predicted DNA binding CopG/RHH family protein
MKRLTLDLPEGLHRAIKHRAVEEGVTMVDLLRKLLEEQYGAGQSPEGFGSRGDGTSVKRR